MTINDSSKRQILWSLLVATFVGTMLRNPAARAANDPCFFVARTGIKWINDPSAEKGFAFFDNGTYVEFWDSRLVNEFGFQDGCRFLNKVSLDPFAAIYGVPVTDYSPAGFSLATIGRNGLGGNPLGGMFIVWDGVPEADAAKPGIFQIIKTVAQSLLTPPHSEMETDYSLAGLTLQWRPDRKMMTATDYHGASRIVIATEPAEPSALIAIKFSDCRPYPKRLRFRARSQAEMTRSTCRE